MILTKIVQAAQYLDRTEGIALLVFVHLVMLLVFVIWMVGFDK